MTRNSTTKEGNADEQAGGGALRRGDGLGEPAELHGAGETIGERNAVEQQA
jgi:hypothetical protein